MPLSKEAETVRRRSLHRITYMKEFRKIICNTMLGFAKDNPVTLREAADYLERYRKLSA